MNRSLWLKIGGTAILLFYLFSTHDFSRTYVVLKESTTWLLLPCLVVSLFSQVLGAYRWQILSTPQGFDLPFREFFKTFMLGNFLSLFLPGTAGGDIGRIFYIAKKSGQSSLKALGTLIPERIFGLLTLLLLTAIAGLLLPTQQIAAYWQTSVLSFCGFTLLGCLSLYLIPIQKLVEKFPHLTVLSHFSVYWRNLPLLSLSLLLSLLAHLLMILIHLLIAQSLGLNLSFACLTWIYGLVSLAAVLPISLNGMGVREGAYIALLGLFGVSSHQGMAFALYWFFILLMTGLLGGWPLLTGNALPRPQPKNTP
ncbi:MAG TPA: lysylphosphatidylglycerol synthase transmembrane domain-containing protein [Oculatellaceae cyanobacterium]|jgi:uncharacterized membrane protein YbhN (UPF0104 family)